MNETRQLVAHLQGLNYTGFSPAVVQAAKLALLDFLGVAIAGSQTEPARIYARYLAESSQRASEKASRFAPQFRPIHYHDAAQLNAVYGHALDFDDVHNASITHLGAISIPVAWALAEEFGLSGQELICAVVAGYEAGARVGEAITPWAYKIWHTTAVAGPFAAAAAAAKLLGLSEVQTLNAFGSAGTQASGLWEFLSNGSMSKVLHVANACAAGLRSAELAQRGFTGAETILEGPAGFLAAMTPQADATKLVAGLESSPLRVLQNSLKAYPCCRHAHAGVFAMQQLMDEHSLETGEIESILDETYALATKTLDKARPENPYAAKFSAQYLLARQLASGQIAEESFEPDAIRDAEVGALMGKVSIRTAEDLEGQYAADPQIWPHRVSLVLKDGRKLSKTVEYPLGDHHNPLGWEEAARKFRGNTEALIGERASEALVDALSNLEKAATMRGFLQQIQEENHE